MLRIKTVADTLTVLRVFLALWIFWLGITAGPSALPTVVTLLMLCWATDLLDGPLARRDPARQQTWIGDHDLEADLAVALGVLGYLSASGYVTPATAMGYVVLGGLLMWYYRSPQLGWALQAPPYSGMLYVALRDGLRHGLWAVGWIAFTVVVTWPRFPKETIPAFLRGMRELGASQKPLDQNRK
ncbi:MAG: CDP-alcohol phosphatidyltransferase family protein [Anaerolineae bacterium]|nr:CDP-alcohol phosphatidyltransferase family protein [Anaerolineae bacterium]